MRAIVARAFGEPDVLRLEEVAEPAPGPGEVLVRVAAAGVNPVDGYMRTGTYAIKPELPWTPGSDGAGEVVALGQGIAEPAVGSRVYLWTPSGRGTYAELVAAPRERVFALPDRLSFEQGAAVGVPYATAYRALHDKGLARPGEWVLVHGATGAVGTALVQLALRHGMQVVATAGSAAGEARLRDAGVRHVVDHGDPEHLARARDVTGGAGLDLIVELLANVNLGRDLGALARRGRVVVVGSRGSVEINPRDLMSRDAWVVGMTLFNATAEEVTALHAGLRAGFADGTLAPVVGRRFPLAEAAEAQRAVLAAGAHGKVVLIP
jgi:NADPH2:quinone reductase